MMSKSLYFKSITESAQIWMFIFELGIFISIPKFPHHHFQAWAINKTLICIQYRVQFKCYLSFMAQKEGDFFMRFNHKQIPMRHNNVWIIHSNYGQLPN